MILQLAHARASIENPNVPISQADDLFGGHETATGLTVTRRAALMYAPVWRAMCMISRDISKVPIDIIRKTDDGSREIITDHPAWFLVNKRPNKSQTAKVWKQTSQGHLMAEGNAFSYIIRKANGDPEELLLLDPDLVVPVRVDGDLWYVITIGTEKRRVPAHDMLHPQGLGWDGLIGYDVITYGSPSFAMGIAGRDFGARYFRDGAAPFVVLEHPAKLGEKAGDRLAVSWNSMHTGLEKSHRTSILEEGMKAIVLNADPKNSQLVELRTFQIREVANMFGVPPHKLGDIARVSYSSLEQEDQDYLDDALDGWMVTWEAELNDKLLTAEQNRSGEYSFQFRRQVLVRADMAARFAAYAIGVNQIGIWSPDDVLAMENRPKRADGKGGEFVRPLNMAVAGDEPGDEPDDGDDNQDRSEWAGRLLACETIGRMVRRLTTSARKSAKNPDGFISDIDEGWDERHVGVIFQALTPVASLLYGLNEASSTAIAQRMADSLISHVRNELLNASECQPSELLGIVDAYCVVMEGVGLRAITDAVIEYGKTEVHNGT